MKPRFPLLLLMAITIISGCKEQSEMIIAIQPIGIVGKERLDVVEQALDSLYDFKIIVLDSIAPPKEAFVNIKTPRYRADELIHYLKGIRPDSVDYIIGITAYDISTTKNKQPESMYKDFGIFGLGYKPGPSCVVSTFRLGKGDKLKSRLAKISVHEVGHNLGLDHCPNKKCVMADAVEKIATVDNAKLALCSSCAREIE